jgi:SAM-dependent methyltransferase
VRIRTPAGQYGRLILQLCLVQENVAWLEGITRQIKVEVAASFREELPPHSAITAQHVNYHDDHAAARQLLLREVTSRFRPGFRILEIGGGCHPQTEGFPGEIYDMDIDVQNLQLGHLLQKTRRNGVQYVCADASDFPFAPKSFDVIAMFSTFHHFADPIHVLRGMKQLLKDDGLLALLCEPVGHYLDASDHKEYVRELELGVNEQSFSLEEYQFIFKEAGVEPCRTLVDGDSFKAFLRLPKEGSRSLAIAA